MECASEGCTCSYSMYRPRGALARALYHKQMADRRLASFDYSKWYRVDMARLDPVVSSTFLQSSVDEETEAFIAAATDASDNILLQIFHSLVKIFLGFFMTQTSINGLLGRGSMQVFSKQQFAALAGLEHGGGGILLDLGAGDGAVTAIMAPFYDSVHVTELSKQMRVHLANRGFRVLEDVGCKQYDMVSCLNVLDRCEKPKEMLDIVKRALSPGAVALIAVVLPFKPYVESGKNHKPQEKLSVTGATFEEQVTSFVHQVLEPNGLEVVRWTRLPYLCEGDLSQSYYWLDDAVFLVKAINHTV